MKRYLRNRWVRMAIGLFALGVGQLLWLITFWPAVFLLAAGIVQVRGQK